MSKTVNAVIYARVSSKGERQDTERQVRDLQKYAAANGITIAEVFREQESGAREDRQVLQACVSFAIENRAAVLVSEISRLGRSVKIVVDTVDTLTKAGISVFFLDYNIWTLDKEGRENPVAKMLLTVLALGAEMERRNIVNRLNSGKALAKERGVRMGRKKGTAMPPEKLLEKYADVARQLRKGQSVRNTAKITGKGVSTVQRVKKALEEE